MLLSEIVQIIFFHAPFPRIWLWGNKSARRFRGGVKSFRQRAERVFLEFIGNAFRVDLFSWWCGWRKLTEAIMSRLSRCIREIAHRIKPSTWKVQTIYVGNPLAPPWICRLVDTGGHFSLAILQHCRQCKVPNYSCSHTVILTYILNVYNVSS